MGYHLQENISFQLILLVISFPCYFWWSKLLYYELPCWEIHWTKWSLRLIANKKLRPSVLWPASVRILTMTMWDLKQFLCSWALKWYHSLNWHVDHSSVRFWSTGPNWAKPRLLTQWNSHTVNVCFKLLILWPYCYTTISN